MLILLNFHTPYVKSKKNKKLESDFVYQHDCVNLFALPAKQSKTTNLFANC